MTVATKITKQTVLDALQTVMDPELNKDLVTLGMIQKVEVDGNNVSFDLVLTTPACPLKKEIEDSAKSAVTAIEGVGNITIKMGANVPNAKAPAAGKSAAGLPVKEPIPGVKNTLAVASGKGGVGKSTVAVNIALSLSRQGAKVGLLDIDIYGPSIPMMMGIHEELKATENEKLVPPESHGIKLMSVGFMIDEETPLIWRGPLVMQLVSQFLKGVLWGELDYLVIDLPPGTGDAQLTLVQTIPLTGVLVVTTPQDVALIDARRAIQMFNKVEVPILGIVENMSTFVCPHCGEETKIFSSGGGEKTSERYEVPLLGTIPIDLAIRECGDAGEPIVSARPDSPEALAFNEIAQKVASRVSIVDLT